MDFDCGNNALRNGPISRHLTPVESGLLLRLATAPPGQVISRSELLDAVWPDREVSDEALTVTISRLRRHFILLGRHGPVIQTLPKVGYRLLTTEVAARELPVSPTPASRTLAWTAIILALVALTVSAMVLATHLMPILDHP